MIMLVHRGLSRLFLTALVLCGLRAFAPPQERLRFEEGSVGQFTMRRRMQLWDGNNNDYPESESSNNNIKIYVYHLPKKYNRDLVRRDPRCLNHMFATEIYVHLLLLSKEKTGRSRFMRTLNPEEADWFFTPVYTNCDLTKNGLPLIDRQARTMRNAVHYISTRWPFWNRTDGADHFFVVPHDFGACYHFKEKSAIKRGVLEVLKRATLLQTFGQRNHACLKEEGSIVIPPYVPPALIQKHKLPPSTPRSTFAYFRGVFYDIDNDPQGGYYARGVRAAIWENFKNNPLFDLSSEHPATYYEDMQRSLFCLCPLGWAPWSPRLVEAVQFGCIPVIIADGIVLPFEDTVPWRSMAVFVDERDVPMLDIILTSIPDHVILAKQRLLADPVVKRALLFPRSPGPPGNAFHQILDALGRQHRQRAIAHT